MNEFLLRRRDCRIGVKALQNMKGALAAFEKLCSGDKFDNIIVGSLFSTGIIRYAKPFVQTKMEGGDGRYPLKRLKDAQGFSMEKHSAVIKLRNTLIAHDDFTQIEPKLLIASISSCDFKIPTTIAISNKCVSHPSEIKDIEAIRNHTAAALNAIESLFSEDIARLRAAVIADPSGVPEARYNADHGTVDIPATGAYLDCPDLSDDTWLVPNEPEFSFVQNGFRYEQVQVQRHFTGPEVIKLPTGEEIHIKPREPAAS